MHIMRELHNKKSLNKKCFWKIRRKWIKCLERKNQNIH